MKRLKVLVGMKQGKLPFDAKGRYEHINGFAYGNTPFTQQTKIISAFSCNILTAKRENLE